MIVTPHCETSSTSDARNDLRAQSNVQFVDRSDFCELLVSSRNLNRCDYPAACVRGIFDPELGLRYLIEEELLFPS